ncbi:MAG: hypothetical protein K0Q55_2049 [Verrucomicrobia bacterium]|nr:hypothetical protein [Verrucomicrobiota bacterium]
MPVVQHITSRCGLCLALVYGGSVVVLAHDAPPAEYRAIVERNAFGLQPIQPELPGQNMPAKDLPQLKLTGLYAQGERTRIFFTKEERGRPVEYHSAWKGETVGGVEFCEANTAAGSVRVRVEDTDLFLSFSGQKAAEVAEEKFVDDHARAHEIRLLKEQEREAAEANAAAAAAK